MGRITRFRELRRKKRMSQKQFAELLGISQTNYGRYETGTRQPDAELLIKIADQFGVSIDYLIGRCDTPYYVRGESGLVPADSIPDETEDMDWLPKTKTEFEQYIRRLVGSSN